MARYIQGYKYLTIHHTVSSAATTKADLPVLARSMETYHKTKSWAEDFKTGGEFGYYYLSYHYLFAQDGSYMQVHDTKYQRVHATDTARGDTSHNLHGIAISVVGNMSTTVPSPALKEGIAQLCAELERKYGVSFAIRGHKETCLYVNNGVVYYPEKTGVYYTGCPGDYMGTSKSGVISDLIVRVNAILTTKPWYETVVPKKIRLVNPGVAYLYSIDTQEKIKEYAPNTVIGVDYTWEGYYVTEFSVSSKIKNGFKIGEWKEFVPEDNLETCKLEVVRLRDELTALQTTYDTLKLSLEENNLLVDELNKTVRDLNTKVAELEIKLSEKAIIIRGKEEEIVSLKQTIADNKKKIEELEKSLLTCSAKAVEQMTWAEILSGVLTKLKGSQPE